MLQEESSPKTERAHLPLWDASTPRTAVFQSAIMIHLPAGACCFGLYPDIPANPLHLPSQRIAQLASEYD